MAPKHQGGPKAESVGSCASGFEQPPRKRQKGKGQPVHNCPRCTKEADDTYSQFQVSKDETGRIKLEKEHCLDCLELADSKGLTVAQVQKMEEKDAKLKRKFEAEQN